MKKEYLWILIGICIWMMGIFTYVSIKIFEPEKTYISTTETCTKGMDSLDYAYGATMAQRVLGECQWFQKQFGYPEIDDNPNCDPAKIIKSLYDTNIYKIINP